MAPDPDFETSTPPEKKNNKKPCFRTCHLDPSQFCHIVPGPRTNRMASAGDRSFKLLTYQLPTVGYWPTVAMTGNGELGFDSGEGA